MPLDEIIDLVAFGASTQKTSSCLGMYLSPEVIYLSETHLDKGKVVVDHLVRIPVPAPEAGKVAAGPATATLNTDFLNDNAKLSALVRQSMSQVKWNTKEVVVTLSHHLGLLRYFAMPAIQRQFWKTSVPLEAKKYIPIPFEVLSHDFQVVPLPPAADNKPRQGALVAVTQKKNLGNITALLESLGLVLVGMEVAPCSALRMFETLDKPIAGKTHCQVHFDGGSIRILVADRSLPVFFRELFLGADASLADFRKVDLGGCISFAQKQLGLGNLSQLRVSGTNSNMNGWAEAFTQEAGAQAQVQDTATMLSIKGGDWGGYSSIGASLRFLSLSPMTLDLGKVGKVTEEERRTARDILALFLIGIVFFLGVGIFNTSILKYRARELKKYKRDAEIEAVFQGKNTEGIQKMLQEMQAQLDLAATLDPQNTIQTTAIMKEIVDSLPEKVWLTSFNFKNALLKGKGRLELTLSGHAVAATLGQERDLCFQFRDQLQKSPIISKTFHDIQISIQGTPMTLEQEGLDPEKLTQRLEGRTTFNIIAKVNK